MKRKASMEYRSEEAWFPLSEDVLAWDDDFHSLMLNDELRMQAYETAIKETVRSGMVVVDLGTGTGILALWALEAGAKKVYGIDVNPNRIPQALERIQAAGFQEKFQIFNALSGDVALPEKADIIISEVLGNLGDNEDMVRILNDARTRFLKPDGLMLPARTETFLVPVSSPLMHEQVRQKKVKGINARYRLPRLLEALRISNPFDLYYDGIIPSLAYLSEPRRVQSFSFTGRENPEYAVKRQFLIAQDGLFTGFKGYFVATLSKNMRLDISGDDIKGRQTSDCWKHCYLPVETPFPVKSGDTLTVTYERRYPSNDSSPFRQCYRWKGSLIRGGIAVYAFDQRMC